MLFRIFTRFAVVTTLFAGVLWSLPAPTPAQAQEAPTRTATVTLRITGMITPNCPVLVEAAARRVDGVVDAHASLEARSATIRYVVGRTNPEALRRLIEDRTGFTAQVSPR